MPERLNGCRIFLGCFEQDAEIIVDGRGIGLDLQSFFVGGDGFCFFSQFDQATPQLVVCGPEERVEADRIPEARGGLLETTHLKKVPAKLKVLRGVLRLRPRCLGQGTHLAFINRVAFLRPDLFLWSSLDGHRDGLGGTIVQKMTRLRSAASDKTLCTKSLNQAP